MITEQYVEFETAKLLKEKEFDVRCRKGYWSDKQLCLQPCSNSADAPVYACPTQSLVMRWLREVHNIDITIDPHEVCDNWIYQFHLCKDRNYLFSRDVDITFENCAEAAIKYCLENLI